LEVLEDRLAPAILTVNSTGDTVSGTTSTLDLRDAILLVNSGVTATDSSGLSLATAKASQISGTLGFNDTINFKIPVNDPGHVCYSNDGVSGQLTMANVTQTNLPYDNIFSSPDRDPDYYASWWTIRPQTALPAITKPVIIDGFTQGAGTSLAANPGQAGNPPLMRIELDGSAIPAANSPYGLTLAGGQSEVQGLVINRFVGAASIGIEVTGAGDNLIWDNFIGTDISGTRLAGNPVANNLDPAVMHVAINVEGTSAGNLIGTDGSPGSLAGNVVCGTGYGIAISGPGVADRSQGGWNVVEGNSIGVGAGHFEPQSDSASSSGPTTYSNNSVTQLMGNAFGVSTALYAHDDQIGAGAPESGHQGLENLISGNLLAGVGLGGGGNQIPGEFGGIIAGNTITHNGHAGIVVIIDSQNCVIEANEIAFNGLIGNTQIGNAPGVWIFNLLNRGTPTGISVLSNLIHDNTGLGIDLGGSAPPPPHALNTSGITPDGPTANDSPNQATGPNHFQNHPVLTSAIASNTGTTITGTFHSTPNGIFRLQFFYNYSAPAHTYPGDPNLYGEGQLLIGEATVTTDAAGNLATSPDGSAAITYDPVSQQYFFTATGVRGFGTNITATATNLDTGDTSEFSPELQVPFAYSNLSHYQVVAEGQSFPFQATIVNDPNNEPLTVSWGFQQVNADGSVNGPPVFGVVGTNPTVTWPQLVALGINDGPSQWLVTMKVSDNQGNTYIDSHGYTLLITNTPPTATVFGPTDVGAGLVQSYTLYATDPSPVDQAAGFTYTVDWGDGTPGSPDVQTFAASAGNGAGLTVMHAYAAAGAYTAHVTATDKDGGVSAAVSTAVQVHDVTSVQIVNPSITSSGQVSFSAKVTSYFPEDDAEGYRYFINWGDGMAQAPDTTIVAASANNGTGLESLPSHTYAPGMYQVVLDATDDFGLSKRTTVVVVVSATAGDSIALSGESYGGVAITTTYEGSTLFGGAHDQVLVAGSGGSDTYTVNFGSNLTTPITITGNGATSGTNVDTLVVNGDNSSTNVINKTPGQITWGSPVTETIYRSGIADTTINANGTQTNYINDPGASTTINGGPGANFITITATTGSGVVINGGPSSNTYTVDLGNLAGPVVIQNSNKGTTDNLIVNGASGDNSIIVTGNQVTAGTQTITDSAPLANLTLVGGGGTNTYTINAGSTVNIVAGTGDNILNVNGGKVGSITAPSGVSVPIVFADNYSMLANGKLSVSAPTGLLANDLPTNGQPLTAVLATGPAHGTLTLNADGSFAYTPAANFVGSDTFTYQAEGSDGSLSALAPVTIQVSYKFSGFLPPLSQGLTYAVNRTIPIQFQLADANGKAITSLSAVSLQILFNGAPITPVSTNNQGLQYTGGQYQFNWQTKGLAAGTYQIVLKLADGTTQTKTIQLTSGGSSAGLVTDGSGGTSSAGALLGGEADLYIDNSNGDLTSDELARIQDAVNSIDATIAPYGVVINEVSDPTQANVTLNMNTTSSLGGVAQGVLGCTADADQVTMVQGWSWYAGSDPTQVGAGQYDFETAVVHELGHVLGLGHSSDSTSVMYASLATGTANRVLTTADLNVPDNDSGPCALHAAPAAAVTGTSNGPSVPAPISTSVPSSGSPMSATDQLFANFTLLLNETRNGNQPALSSVAALWQSMDALMLQRLDALLSKEAGAMGVTKDNLMRDLLFASGSSSNGV
jgi:hypothetical protein